VTLPIRSGRSERTQDEVSSALGGNIEAVSAVAEVTRRLLAYFSSDEIQPGDRLPAERQLASVLGVGRSAVREALAALELLGMVNIRPGSGTYLRGRASELLPQTLSWGLLINTPETLELIGVRHGLEVQAARLAAQFATPETLADMEQQLLTMEGCGDDYETFVAADMRFHQAVALSSQNSLLTDLLQTVRSLIRVWVDRAMHDAAHAQSAIKDHREIFDAITAGDADRAAAVMERHMQIAKRRLSKYLDGANQAGPSEALVV
jgi:GntR family transcriptional repressor for pyruvate dehydrogenase complex